MDPAHDRWGAHPEGVSIRNGQDDGGRGERLTGGASAPNGTGGFPYGRYLTEVIRDRLGPAMKIRRIRGQCSRYGWGGAQQGGLERGEGELVHSVCTRERVAPELLDEGLIAEEQSGLGTTEELIA